MLCGEAAVVWQVDHMRRHHRWLWLACALIVALAATGVSKAQDNVVVAIRDSPELLKYYRLLLVADPLPQPLSYLDSPHPFRAISLDVRGQGNSYLSNDDLVRLSDFARHAMRARLEELGAAGEIMVMEEPDPWSQGWFQGRPPEGLSVCDVFHVMFKLSGAPPTSAVAESGAVGISLLAYHPAAESQGDSPEQNCLGNAPRPSWVLLSGPVLFMVQRSQEDLLLGQAREQILGLIDRELIVNAIIRSNKTARDSFNEIAYGHK